MFALLDVEGPLGDQHPLVGTRGEDDRDALLEGAEWPNDGMEIRHPEPATCVDHPPARTGIRRGDPGTATDGEEVRPVGRRRGK